MLDQYLPCNPDATYREAMARYLLDDGPSPVYVDSTRVAWVDHLGNVGYSRHNGYPADHVMATGCTLCDRCIGLADGELTAEDIATSYGLHAESVEMTETVERLTSTVEGVREMAEEVGPITLMSECAACSGIDMSGQTLFIWTE